MIKTPLSTVIGGVGMYTKNTLVIGGQKSKPQFDFASLFKNGEQGLFYDPHTLESGLVGQTVPTIPDLSSNNNHGSNLNSAQQMLLEVDAVTGYKYLKADGVDDHYVTQSIDFTHTNQITIIAAVRKLAQKLSMLCELSDNSSNQLTQNSFYLAAPETALGAIYFRSRATAISGQIARVNAENIDKCVITCISNIPSDINKVSVNRVFGTNSTADLGNGTLGNYPVYIGSRGGVSYPWHGHLYGLLIIDRILTDAEIQKVEAEFAKRMGVTL